MISAYNEEKKVEDCLKSVADLATEIIFVDNNSEDKTEQIARKYTSKIFKRENNLMLNVNKNYGFGKASGDWILSLDGDEEIPSELKDEIGNILKEGESEINGYFIPRKNIIFGKWIERAGWYPDYQLRLFKRNEGRFPEKNVHEMIEIEGKTSHLKHPMLHRNYETISQFLQKHTTIYAPNEAKDLLSKGYRFDYLDSIRFPVREFTNRFFAREGYKDGVHGLVLSLLLASYHLMIFCFLWEQRGFSDKGSQSVLNDTKNEFKKSEKELNYWFLTSIYKNTDSIIKRALIRFKRKMNGL